MTRQWRPSCTSWARPLAAELHVSPSSFRLKAPENDKHGPHAPVGYAGTHGLSLSATDQFCVSRLLALTSKNQRVSPELPLSFVDRRTCHITFPETETQATLQIKTRSLLLSCAWGVHPCLICRMTPAPTPAPLSVGLLCVYKQYKADTETIAIWLKTNAVKHGYKFDGQDGIIIRTSDFIPSELLQPFQSMSYAHYLAFGKLEAITRTSKRPYFPKTVISCKSQGDR